MTERLTTYIRDKRNEHGTPISVFQCTDCHMEFSICPSPPPEDHWMWTGCGDYECASYDVSRDVLAIVGFGWGELHSEPTEETP